MSFTLFINFSHGGKPAARTSAEDDAKLTSLLKPIKGLTRAHVYTPSKAHDPFLDDGAPPRLVLQLFFEKLPDLEASVSRTGPLQALATDFPSLADAPMTYEAMVARIFPTPEPKIRAEPWCSYLVAYEGPAEDPNLWLEHYIAHHPPIMRTMPGIRELEIYTAIDWIGFLPAKKVRHLQRNKTHSPPDCSPPPAPKCGRTTRVSPSSPAALRTFRCRLARSAPDAPNQRIFARALLPTPARVTIRH